MKTRRKTPTTDLARAKEEALKALQEPKPDEPVKKKRKRRRRRPRAPSAPKQGENDDGNDVEIEYVVGAVGEGEEQDAEDLGELRDVLERFRSRADGDTEMIEDDENEHKDAVKGEGDEEKGTERKDGDGDENDRKEDLVGRKRQRLRERYSVAELKAEVNNPEVVDPWDVTAADPRLLISLKSLRNSVPVPQNWKLKRKYLQNKRGMEKPAFQLPAFIVDTGIQGMRDAYSKVEDQKSLKQKQREKIRPKAHKGAEIDESILRDAFFKFQTKPRLTTHGDLYYEMRELEVSRANFLPGSLSENLRAALGMTEPNSPPPWLIAMQRFGPPPSYPNLKIPGLNAPIPAGCSFGYQPGGWGKPPVDATGRPIFGDVFNQGIAFEEADQRFQLSAEEKSKLWGEPIAAKDLSESIAAPPPAEKEKPKIEQAPGILPDKIAVPEEGVELRKGIPEGSLYRVLEQREKSVGNSLMGSSHTYNLELNSGVPVGPKGGASTTKNTTSKDSLEHANKIAPEALSKSSADLQAMSTKAGSKAKDYKF
eukprot:Plantae.Rhodophyta-Hildenbrandia_rubra.ctg45410.p1 GENE.Plantae.Rhodophyta-Hildenbrandia_rubra.ctg45410~~Plantae.Rhodophyta-Hildenbrandia_rubra.ctg45410.p1  ORF type:complete len:538 (+),score=131.32 Plantae.Rhodophyta-Hildenbrandia_rubra.ctg45410:57-1670(+)